MPTTVRSLAGLPTAASSTSAPYIAGREANIVPIDEEALGFPTDVIDLTNVTFPFPNRHYMLDAARLRADLGFESRVSIRRMIEEFAADWSEKPDRTPKRYERRGASPATAGFGGRRVTEGGSRRSQRRVSMQLFNESMTRDELLRHVGGLQQIACVQLMSFEEAHSRGSRFLDFRTGSGFHFTVMIDRGMDPGFCDYRGASMAWIPARRLPAPWYFDGSDVNWVRVALGGLCNTCGLVHIGNPQDIDTAYYGWTARETDRYGVHDRIAVTPAERFSYGERWEGDRCFLWAEGTIREEIVYGENLVLTRRYEAELGKSAFTIHDAVTNEGHYESPHQILYHFNIGYPVVDDGAELLGAVSGPVPGSMFDEDADAQSEKYRTFIASHPKLPRRGIRDSPRRRSHRADGCGRGQPGIRRWSRPRRLLALRYPNLAHLYRVAHDGRRALRRRHGAGIESVFDGSGAGSPGIPDHAAALRTSRIQAGIRRVVRPSGDRRISPRLCQRRGSVPLPTELQGGQE